MPLAWHHCDNLSRSSWSARESSGVVIFKLQIISKKDTNFETRGNVIDKDVEK